MKEAMKKLKELKAKRILVQLPEGLKLRIQDITKELEENGFEVFLSIESTFGACDLRDREAKALGCDSILHVGHSSLGLKAEVPVIYEEYRQDFDPVPLLEKALVQLPYKSVGLVTTVQHISSLVKAKGFLEKNGKNVHIGQPESARYPGQILGCDHSAALSIEKNVDCFLYIGSGLFHPLGLAEKTEKPVIFLDIESGELKDLSEERPRRQKIRAANLAKASMSVSFGILVSTKSGQMNMRNAEKAKKALEEKGKRAWLLAADLITPEKLLGLELDCLVNCACPRITEDVSLFRKPIITAEEAERI